MSAVMSKNTATPAADAAKIVPRAEFRVFGKEINELVEQKMWDAGAVLQKARKMPAETYFLSAKTDDANVKVRDGLLDIKVKVGTTPEGYEIFQPHGKFHAGDHPGARVGTHRRIGLKQVSVACD